MEVLKTAGTRFGSLQLDVLTQAGSLPKSSLPGLVVGSCPLVCADLKTI